MHKNIRLHREKAISWECDKEARLFKENPRWDLIKHGLVCLACGKKINWLDVPKEIRYEVFFHLLRNK
jgi:hypothetical protein